MSTIHVLSIGNSFSRDAHSYLHDYAYGQGVDIQTVNLYIPGCSLERHYLNLLSGDRAYTMDVNGHTVEGSLVSIEEAVHARKWDVVTLQQASHESYTQARFFPYINCLSVYIRKHCPSSCVLLHQTWAYESYSKRILDHGFQTYDEMFRAVKHCYDAAAEKIGADGIIRCGEAFCHAFHSGLKNLHRDTFHASYGVGRMLLAMVWYRILTGKDASQPDRQLAVESITEEEYRIMTEAANQTP